MKKTFELDFYGRKITIENGEVAKQAATDWRSSQYVDWYSQRCDERPVGEFACPIRWSFG